MIIRLNCNIYLKPDTPIPDLKNILQRLSPWLVNGSTLSQIRQASAFLIEECHHDEQPPISCIPIFKHIFYEQPPWP